MDGVIKDASTPPSITIEHGRLGYLFYGLLIPPDSYNLLQMPLRDSWCTVYGHTLLLTLLPHRMLVGYYTRPFVYATI